MATKKLTLLIRVHPSTKDALRKAARDYDRSMAWLVEKYAVDALRRNGYLPEVKRKK